MVFGKYVLKSGPAAHRGLRCSYTFSNKLYLTNSYYRADTSPPLPSDQWVIEVECWFATGLAKLQNYVVWYATGPNVVDGAYISKPQDPISQMLCNSQGLRSTGNITSFSTAGVIIILAVGGLLIFINLSLDTLVGYVQRRWNIRDYQHIQWVMEDKLGLPRVLFAALFQRPAATTRPSSEMLATKGDKPIDRRHISVELTDVFQDIQDDLSRIVTRYSRS